MTQSELGQSPGVVEYTDCFSPEENIPRNKCPGYDTKQSDADVLIMLVLWKLQSTLLLTLLSGPLWPAVVESDRALPMGKIELI